MGPPLLRAQISAIFLLISSLIGLGIGTTLVALITDKVFGDTNMVGYSISIVGGFSALLTIILLKTGCKHFVKSLDVEKDEMVR